MMKSHTEEYRWLLAAVLDVRDDIKKQLVALETIAGTLNDPLVAINVDRVRCGLAGTLDRLRRRLKSRPPSQCRHQSARTSPPWWTS